MIDSKTLDHLAHLARLNVEEQEKEQLVKDIGNIVNFIDTISNIKITDQGDKTFIQKNVTRDDVIEPLKSFYNLVETAPLHKDGFVKVPKVIGE